MQHHFFVCGQPAAVCLDDSPFTHHQDTISHAQHFGQVGDGGIENVEAIAVLLIKGDLARWKKVVVDAGISAD